MQQQWPGKLAVALDAKVHLLPPFFQRHFGLQCNSDDNKKAKAQKGWGGDPAL